MGTSLGKKILRRTFLILPWMLAALLATGWSLSVWTPTYLERLIPKLAHDMGLPVTEFNIRNAGLFSADIGPVQLGEGSEAVRVDNVHLSYTPASLKQRRINSVTLDGVTMGCAWKDGQLSIPALGMLPVSESDSDDATLPQLPFDELIVNSSILTVETDGKVLSIPFDAVFTPGEPYTFAAHVRPRDQLVDISGTLGPTSDDLRLAIATKRFYLGAFADFLPAPVNGRVDLDITGNLKISQPEQAVADFGLTIHDGDLSSLGLGLAEGETLAVTGSLADQEVRFAMDAVNLSSPMPATVTIQAGRAARHSMSAQFSVAGAGVEMGGRFDADEILGAPSPQWDISLTAVNPDSLTVKTGGRDIGLQSFIFSLSGVVDAGAKSAEMVLNCSTRGASLARTGFRMGRVRLELPLAWPAPKHHKPGSLRVSGLSLKDQRLGNMSARVRQEGTDIAYGGTLRTDILPKLRIGFSGQASMVNSNATVNFSIDKYRFPAGFDPSTVVKDLKGMTVAGVLNATGAIMVDMYGLHSHLGMNVADGMVTLAEGATTIEGINLSFESPDLYNLRSLPAQQLTFDSLTSGAIRITNGEIAYQLEPEGVVFFEQAGFDWCGGHVASRSFRINPEAKDYKVTMFCSELKLSEILEQLGLAKSDGEASLSGELPVRWNRGKISFNNGFLHSTPGEGGVIQVEAMQDLVDSIPKGTPQRGQLELAREAVRDFEYKWVRIKADTVGEDLLVRLSVDGKPKGTLPFVYKKEFGGFMRVTGDVKGSNFQGLRLDVNFSVPLDRILLYKDIVNMIE